MVETTGGLDQFRDLAIRTFSRTVYPKHLNLTMWWRSQMATFGSVATARWYTLRNGTNTFTAQGIGLKGKQVTTIFRDDAGHIWNWSG